MSGELQGHQQDHTLTGLEAHRSSARLPLSQRHLRKTPGQLRHAGFLLAVWLHLLFLAPPYLSYRYLDWPSFHVLTWSGLLQWIYILPVYLRLRRQGQTERALGLLMNAVGLFCVFAFLTAVGWLTG